jgi:predicted nucleic acid-binding protein
MGATTARKRFALDTNLIFDLAEEKNFALTFVEVFLQRGYELFLPPTAAQELAHAVIHNPEKREIAKKGLRNLRKWDIQEFDLVAVDHGITEQFSLLIRTRNLLPVAEVNDGLILAETSLARIPVLVTSDKHLLNIPEESLASSFKLRDLAVVAVCHPKDLLRAIQ